MLDIIASAEYYAALGTATENDKPQDLAELTRDACTQRFRRIDRFTQLALIGSARCAGEAGLPPETGLFIGSGLGAVGNTVAVHQHLYVERKIPRPADFVNTLSNSAGYYVARNLGLTDQNIFVSRGAGSAAATFELAALEIVTGALQLALIGLVDEFVVPAHHHAHRLRVSGDTDMAEGSHWFLVRASSAAGGKGRVLAARTLAGSTALVEWLSGVVTIDRVLLNLGPSVNPGILGEFASLPRFEPTIGFYLSRMAGVLARYLDSSVEEDLILLDADAADRFHVMLASRATAS